MKNPTLNREGPLQDHWKITAHRYQANQAGELVFSFFPSTNGSRSWGFIQE